MFEILNKQIVTQDIKRIDIYAPDIAKKVEPGQFVRVSPEEGDEHIPLSVVDWDRKKGTISFIFQEIGQTTGKLGSLPINEPIFSVLGPLGFASKIEKKGTVVCIATGIGTAQILPICRAYQKSGNKVIGIIGAKTKKNLLLEAQMRIACNKVFIATQDGTYERKGLATDVLKDLVHKKEVDFVYAIGSIEMMKEVCRLTQDNNIPTRVQLKPIMVDCLGMCGSCRVKVDNKIVFACVEGPEFDGHKVDFDDFIRRMKGFEESVPCPHKTQFNQQKKESGPLMRFLSGILSD
ncbi:MAG: sulfide/dihydroorotate dehydrogenase-like FAD/NAD-binding protein [Candidatus Omnitrophica bacterium]|nr:sulfide/dihydroorotate dehydrogenase-like FAD/NAD-binding protein [Candidatus Omnitrophota bacterium]